MKKFLFIFLLLSTACYADVSTQKYAVKKPDGSISIVYYINGSSDSLDKVLKDSGLSGLPIYSIKESDFPLDRSDRKYWTITNGTITIDTVKKQADIDAQSTAQNISRIKRLSALSKICASCTTQDLKDLLT